MATAAGVTVQRNARAHVVTTLDANLSLVSCPADVASVLIQPTSAAGALVQIEGATQGGSPASSAIEVVAGGSLLIVPEDCGVGAGQAWSFGVARASAGAVIRLNASVR